MTKKMTPTTMDDQVIILDEAEPSMEQEGEGEKRGRNKQRPNRQAWQQQSEPVQELTFMETIRRNEDQKEEA